MSVHRLAKSLGMVAAAAVLLVPAVWAARPAAAEDGPTIAVGSGETGYAVNLFGAPEITVVKGTTVTFEAGWLEPHTVTFPGTQAIPSPEDPNAAVPTHPGQVVEYDGTQFVNSGFIASGGTFGENKSFQITFAKQGSFPYVCIIHPGMEGTVNVIGGGSVTSQGAIDAASTTRFASALTALKAEAKKLAEKQVTKVANADGTTTWRVNTVGGIVPPSDVQQFFPPAMNLQEGDTVVWESSVPTPHTVTFLGGADLGKIIAEGPPDILANPKILLPTQAPAAGYDGNGYINSGVLGITGFPAGTSYSVKFSKAGSYSYFCILHVEQGMGGVVNVSAKSAPSQANPAATASTTPAPPKTGSGDLVAEGDAPFIGLMLAGFAVALLAGVRLVTRRSAR
ncbi:MAG: plastocyanin/azurin family copper-binding protein [Dehalococcoidia bacterium]